MAIDERRLGENHLTTINARNNLNNIPEQDYEGYYLSFLFCGNSYLQFPDSIQ
jgi:hypothetical protein